MQTFRLLLLTIAASLCGCTRDALTESGLSSGKSFFYNCVRAGQPDTGHSLSGQVVVLNRNANESHLTVAFEDGQQQVLDPVQGRIGHLFANQLYAWRVGANGSVLTDVKAISTYACTPISHTEAPEPSTGASSMTAIERDRPTHAPVRRPARG